MFFGGAIVYDQKMINLAMLFAAVPLPTPLAEGAWACSHEEDGDIAVVVSYDSKGPEGGRFKRGRVDVGQNQDYGFFEVQGLERRWLYGLNDNGDGHRYVFTIGPDGKGRQFDFNNAKAGEQRDAKYTLYCYKLPELG